MSTKPFTRLTALAFVRTPTRAALLLLSAAIIWLLTPAGFAADETCARCGQEFSVSGEFAPGQYDATLTIDGASNNAAAFHEEIYGENFTVTVAHLPTGKYEFLVGPASDDIGIKLPLKISIR